MNGTGGTSVGCVPAAWRIPLVTIEPPGPDTAPRPIVRVSVILPVHNGEKWIDGCFEALLGQTVLSPDAGCRQPVQLELSAFDDGSADGSWAALVRWRPRLEAEGIAVVLSRSGASCGSGCGFAKNRAVAQSTGEWLCFHDVDDVSMPNRIEAQLSAAAARPDALIGARVVRHPLGSTDRYVSWANRMSPAELSTHRFRECTLLMPTWFLSRACFTAVGGFREEHCEDLLFLHAHVRRGGALVRVDGPPLVEYRCGGPLHKGIT
jgi:glycosyltransferase involved in cell wall biosynthesis